MADPISLLGLVAGIVTFVDFGLKIISRSKSVRRSLDGMTLEIGELERSIKHVRTLNNSIAAQRRKLQHLSGAEAEVVAMAEESEKLYTRIQCSIKKLKVRAGARSKTLEAGRITFRSFWSHNELLELAKRLMMLDQRIRTSVQTILEMNHHTSVMSKLRAIQSTQAELGINHDSHFDRIKKDILELTMARQQDGEVQVATQFATLESLNTKLKYLVHEYSVSSYRTQVIKSLYFGDVYRRSAQVPLADERSNDWVYDSKLTTYVTWLESSAQSDGIFYIRGKAGCGKSTLMKFIYNDDRTHAHLKEWAGAAKLYTGSYYFWNQGGEMQKSRIGLMQSLLYQVFRSAPQLIPPNMKDRLHHEVWRLEELVAMLHHIAGHEDIKTKFCFFIDGLDEYNGDESDIAPMLQALSVSPHVKICASSRPGRIYDKFLHRANRNFDMAEFTRDAMRDHVRAKLFSSAKFQQLALYEPECATVISNISENANGVWLWVWLVTRDILFEVERDETVGTLRRIVDEFPEDLEQYFKRIIGRIKKRHREDMAKIFLVTMHELQPLPLYAFTLLRDEGREPGSTLIAPFEGWTDDKLRLCYPSWRARIQNRCGDLLIVDQNQQPGFQADLTIKVDFFHRTARDFLRDCYHDELLKLLKNRFNPLLALCQICLGLLKSVHVENMRHRGTLDRILRVTDELLYYAYELEKTCSTEEEEALMPILNGLDAVNSHHAKHELRNHWTHARKSPRARGLDEYREGGHCNFLALAVQAQLVKYVRLQLEAVPHRLQKLGRPLLDYALRPLRNTPVERPFHLNRDEPAISVDMVRLLLSHGADPNQEVHLYHGEPVWALFAISILETTLLEEDFGVQASLKRAWYQCCEDLIEAGARFDHAPAAVVERDFTIPGVFDRVFGIDEAARLMCRIEEKAVERNPPGNSCLVM